MVQLGLCAFRHGLIHEAHQCLSEICSKRPKELLAQGIARSFHHRDQDPEAEKEERRRQLPYHMHINIDLLELCHLTSAMLLEVPNLATMEGRVDRKRVISGYFRKVLQQYETQAFAGPPEIIRDHILAAASALATGDWPICRSWPCNTLTGSRDLWERMRGWCTSRAAVGMERKGKTATTTEEEGEDEAEDEAEGGGEDEGEGTEGEGRREVGISREGGGGGGAEGGAEGGGEEGDIGEEEGLGAEADSIALDRLGSKGREGGGEGGREGWAAALYVQFKFMNCPCEGG
ncbi:eukaryotic translation initiation factor 3 subunit c [Nannochloropsis oceanica]